MFKVARIRNKVCVPDAAGIRLALAAEVFRLAVKAIGKITGRIENKIGAMEEVKNDGHAVNRKKPRRLASLAVEMLIPGIERQCEEAPFLPFERLFSAFIIPNSGSAASLQNIAHVFIEMSLGIETFSR